MTKGAWRAILAAAYGQFETSHVATCPDVAPECATTPIPPHEHHVTLDLYHTDLIVDYGASSRVTASLRLPFDVKDQTVRYTTLSGEPFVPPYGDIHHRSETLDGVGDMQLTGLVALGAGFQAGAGISIPTGETVPNPIELGREGLTHEHIQFGSGTVDPVVSALWSGSFGWLGAVAAADGQFPLYENSHGFHAPTTVRWAAGPTATVGTTGLSVQYAGQYQSIGRWNGEIDEGTGFVNGGIFFRASFLPWPRFRVAPSVYFELYSKSLSDQAFRQNTTFAVTLTRFF